jgi:hypothetical protein
MSRKNYLSDGQIVHTMKAREKADSEASGGFNMQSYVHQTDNNNPSPYLASVFSPGGQYAILL